ncbi:MAG: hypothetical protein EOP42_30500, partial [Sphingobacteriaceae bacterium]
MKKYLFALSLFALFPFSIFAQQKLSGADSARKVIDTMLNYAKQKSIYRNKVDWKILTDSVRKHSAKATSIKEAIQSVPLFYQLLGDFHGFVSYQKKTYKWRTKKITLDTVKYKSLLSKLKQMPKPETKLLEEGYGYLLIPTNNPTRHGETDRLAQEIQDSLSKLHPEKLTGLIIDLRSNPGGNMYPMILGVANLLGRGNLGSFIDPVTNEKTPWEIKGKAIFVGKDKVCQLKTPASPALELKVAVLIGPYTASSGEATAISFKGRKNTRLFGEKTAGYTTANQSFRIFDLDIFMATGAEADRNNVVYYELVSPDQEIIACTVDDA